MARTRISRRASGAMILVLAGLIFLVFYLLSPWVYDDVSFYYRYRLFSPDGSLSLDAFWQYFLYLGEVDNRRLANVFCFLQVFWPGLNIAYKFLMAALVPLIMWQVARLAWPNSSLTWRGLVAVWAVLLVALPWRAGVFTVTIASNYVCSSVILLAAMWSIAQGKSLWQCMLWASLCCLWHEGFGLALCGGLALLLICREIEHRSGAYRHRLFYTLLIAALVLGALVAGSGTVHRASGETNHPAILTSPASWCFFNYLSLTLYFTLLISLIVKRTRRYIISLLRDDTFALPAAVGVAALGMTMLLIAGARTAWCSQLCAAVCWCRLLTPVAQSFSPKLQKLASCVLLTLILLQAAVTVPWMHRITCLYNNVLAQLAQRGVYTAYVDIPQWDDVPDYTLAFPFRDLTQNGFFYDNLFRLSCEPGKIKSAVPSELGRPDIYPTPELQGEFSRKLGLHKSPGGLYFCSRHPYDDGEVYIETKRWFTEIITAKGLTTCPFLIVPYIAPDGQTYYYLQAERCANGSFRFPNE